MPYDQLFSARGLDKDRGAIAGLLGVQRPPQFLSGAGLESDDRAAFSAHEHLENKLAAFVNKPASLLFSTGYLANLGAVQALVSRGDTVYADKLNHASLNEAMLLSRASVKRYRHNDVEHLERMLCSTKNGRKLIITDAVFSMDGDFAPIPRLLTLCEQYDA